MVNNHEQAASPTQTNPSTEEGIEGIEGKEASTTQEANQVWASFSHSM